MPINPHEEPLAWACQQLEGEMRALEEHASTSVAWSIIKSRIEAYSRLLETTDRMYTALVGALQVGPESNHQVMRFRTQVARLKYENDRAMEVLQGTQAG